MGGWVCPRCRNPLPAGATACLSCGLAITEVPSSPPATAWWTRFRPASTRPGNLAALALLVALVGGYGLSQYRAGGSAPAANDGTRSPVTVSGAGISNSGPMTLSGDYQVQWQASRPPGHKCYHGTSLRTVDNRLAADLISTMVTGSGSGTVYVYGLDAGRYFVEASSGCDTWSFTFVPN